MINLLKPLNELRGKCLCGIYVLYIKNHTYIGSTRNIKQRLRQHRENLRNQKHRNSKLQNCYNKYSELYYDILKILDPSISDLELHTIEKEFIQTMHADLNIADPLYAGKQSTKYKVYQYDMEGNFIKEWKTAREASRALNICDINIYVCCNSYGTVSKSAGGFRWSKKKVDKLLKYENNTGSNLDTREVHLYTMDDNYFRSFNSLSNCARWLAKSINYQKDWKYLRSNIGYALKNNKTRTVRKLYKISYNKANSFKDTFNGLLIP